MAIFALLIAVATITVSTFAWYIYNTSAHTTKVRMAAGSSVSLEISNKYDGEYSSTTVFDDKFVGKLSPVSTDRILDSSEKETFQKVKEFVEGTPDKAPLLAKFFKPAEAADYYKTSLYVRSRGSNCDLYLSDIGFEDADKNKPISTATRIGLVIRKPGKNKAVDEQYIFSINPKGSNPAAEYNTFNGSEGSVLSYSKTDGTTVKFDPLTSENFAEYDSKTGIVTVTKQSQALCELKGDDDPVQIDIYVWLEGCDKDCTLSLMGATLKNISLSFAGYMK